MKRNAMVLLLVLAACGPASAPAEGPATVITPLMLEPPPIYALLGFRDRLELTSEQIVRLDSIATAVKDQNNQLRTELSQKAEPTRSQTALVVGEEAKPVLERIRDNNLQAARAVGTVLNDAQQETACQLFDMQREDREDREGRRERGPDREERADRRRQRGRGAFQLDTTLINMQRRVWPWCTAAAPRDRR